MLKGINKKLITSIKSCFFRLVFVNKRIEKMLLLTEIVKIIVNNNVFFIFLVDKTKLKNTCFLLMNPHSFEPLP